MNKLKFAFTLFLAFGTSAAPVSTAHAQAQDPQNQNASSALMRGYRTGYSDGFQAGVTDVGSGATQDFRNKPEYQNADRAYTSTYGSLEDYRDAYRKGFEAGNNVVYESTTVYSTIPPDLKRL